jgi:hypothetical protein
MKTTVLKKHVEFNLADKYDSRKWWPATDVRRVATNTIYAMVKDEDEDIKPGSSVTIDVRIKVTHE